MTASPLPAPLPVLVFDGDCGFCTRCVEWGRRRIGAMPAAVPYQQADLAALGLDAQRCAAALQYVARDRRVYSAHDAVAALLLGAGRGWWLLGAVLRLPGVHWLAGVSYRWVARNRFRLSPNPSGSCAAR